MRRMVFALTALAGLAGVAVYGADAAGQGGRINIPEGYRDWRLIAVAHEEGMLNDLRAILGNDAAIKAARDGATNYPDGAVIARLAWSYEP